MRRHCKYRGTDSSGNPKTNYKISREPRAHCKLDTMTRALQVVGMTRMEGTRYSVRSEFMDTVTVISRWTWTPIRVEMHCPRAVSIATTCELQLQAAAQSAGAGIREDKMTVLPCELSQTSNSPKPSRRTNQPTSSSHAEPRDH